MVFGEFLESVLVLKPKTSDTSFLLALKGDWSLYVNAFFVCAELTGVKTSEELKTVLLNMQCWFLDVSLKVVMAIQDDKKILAPKCLLLMPWKFIWGSLH